METKLYIFTLTLSLFVLATHLSTLSTTPQYTKTNLEFPMQVKAHLHTDLGRVNQLYILPSVGIPSVSRLSGGLWTLQVRIPFRNLTWPTRKNYLDILYGMPRSSPKD